ncbi:MAG TPA: hypothetical protein VFA12_01595 [Stellaceae bacterium]|nr:hypothetical protein [Stellaceae bacterium]
MRKTHVAVWLALGAAMLAAPPVAAAGGLADGTYDCGGGYTYRAMGKVDIKGDQYRYRPYDDPGGSFAPYTVEPNGAIRWGGHFGGLDDPPARIVDSTRESFGFNVRYQGSPGALINTMSCHAPGK